MSDPEEPATPLPVNPDTLHGWKEIASYLGRSTRTVQRWEREYGLPIHRVGAARGEVLWASRAELDRWKESHAETTSAAANRAPADPTARPSDQTIVSADSRLPTVDPAVVQSRRTVHTIHEAPRPFIATAFVGRGWMWLVAGAMTVGALLGWLAWHTPVVRLQMSTTGPVMRAQGETFPFEVTGFSADGSVTRWARVPNGNIEAIGDPIREGPDGRLAWSLTTDCATETGTHRIWLIDDGTGGRSNEIEVIVLPNPACAQPTVDLAARAVSLDKVSVRPGDVITVKYEIWNLGAASAAATTTRVRLGAESARSRVTDAPLGDDPVPAIEIGGRIQRQVDVWVPSTTTPGVYYVWVVADNTSVTIESSSFNNFARSNALLVAASP